MDTGWTTTGPVVPLQGRARWTIALLAATLVVDVLAVGVDVWEISLLDKVLDGRVVSLDDLNASDTRQSAVGLLEFGVLIATVVLFIRWFSAAYRNLTSLGATALRYTPGWAIGAWFVPVLGFVRPKQIANDIWRASDPDAPADQAAGWRDRPVPSLLDLWWAMWILASLVQNFGVRAWFDSDTAGELRSRDRADIAGVLLDIVAAVLAILVVRGVTRRQAERASRLRHNPVSIVAAPL